MKRIDSIPGVRDHIKDGIKGGHYWPLLPRHEIYLSATGCDGRRFASLFRETWKRLPLWARRRMLGHWRAKAPTLKGWLTLQQLGEQNGIRRKPDPKPQYWMCPLIKLTSDPLPDDVLGMVNDRGVRLSFHGEPVAAMPDDVVQDLIAHELIHVVQTALGIRTRLEHTVDTDGHIDTIASFYTPTGEYWGDAADLENDADLTMVAWGFVPDSIDRWSLAEGRSKTIIIQNEEDLARHIARFGRATFIE